MIHIVSTGLFIAGDTAAVSSSTSVTIAGDTINANNSAWTANLDPIDWGHLSIAHADLDTSSDWWRGADGISTAEYEIKRMATYEELEALMKRVADLEELIKNLWQAKSVGDLL